MPAPAGVKAQPAETKNTDKALALLADAGR